MPNPSFLTMNASFWRLNKKGHSIEQPGQFFPFGNCDVSMRVSAFCKYTSQVHGVEYVPRNNVTLDNLDYNPSMSRFDTFYYELASGSILVAIDSRMAYLSYLAGLECHIHDQPETIPNGNAYFLARGYGRGQWAVGLIQNYIYIAERYDEFKFNRRVGGISNEFEVFGVSAFV